MRFRVGRLLVVLLWAARSALAAPSDYLSPDAILASPRGDALFVACGTGQRILRVDVNQKIVRDSLATPAPATGLALSPDGNRLYVTCAAPESTVLVVDVPHWKILSSIPVGHTALSPVLGLDGHTLYVCDQFNNDVSVVDLNANKELTRIPVQREPIAADITRDGRYLLVANQLSTSRSDAKDVAAAVSVLDLLSRRTVKEMTLPVGSEMLKGLRVAPDGKYAVVTHIFCNYDLPTRRVDHGLMNANALTILNLANLEPLRTILLDEPTNGAGNPWAVAWSADSSRLVVTHAGTHEVSLIDFQALLAGLPPDRKAKYPASSSTSVLKFVPHYEDEESNDGLPYLVGGRRRVRLPSGDLAPRAVTIVGATVYTANYFSDTVSAINLTDSEPPESVPLGEHRDMDSVRRGEFYFHDAALCLQGWQSCSSCHPGGGRVDALNWDLATEGPGHPRNTRSILFADKTEPLHGNSMNAAGMGATLEDAVHVAVKSLLFTNLPENISQDMVDYIKSLQPVPSPYLVHGRLSPAAERGSALFTRAGCIQCHAPGLYTDRQFHEVGTRTRFDSSPEFCTPSLLEAWRTAPYLHNGAAATIRDVLTTCNPKDGEHGDVSGLSPQEIEDLCQFVLSL